MNLLTRIIASIRYPESAFGKNLQRIIPIILLIIIVVLGLSCFAIYRTVLPEKLVETIDPSSFLLRDYQSLPFRTRDNKSFEGWFIPSVRGAPVVFLCHGYKSNRSELLTLASTFQENGYNLFLFDFRGHGANPSSFSTLGLRESDDLLSAIKTIMERGDVDHERAGVWGVGLGAYVALSVAQGTEKVKILVVDSPFDSPGHFLEMQTASALGLDNFAFKKLARFGFLLINLPQTPDDSALMKSMSRLQGRPKLFITNEETPLLETQALGLFNQAPEPKELLRLKHSKTSILYDVERKIYENTVVDFFKKNLPVRERS